MEQRLDKKEYQRRVVVCVRCEAGETAGERWRHDYESLRLAAPLLLERRDDEWDEE